MLFFYQFDTPNIAGVNHPVTLSNRRSYMNKFINVAAAMVISMPLLAQAQNAPQVGAIVASAPGEAAVVQSIQVQGKVKSIDTKKPNRRYRRRKRQRGIDDRGRGRPELQATACR
jgi:hypothetical protein